MYLYELVLLLLLLLLVVVVLLLLVVLAAFLLGWDGTELPKSHGPSPTSFQTCDYSHIIVTKKSMYNNLWIWIFGGVTWSKTRSLRRVLMFFTNMKKQMRQVDAFFLNLAGGPKVADPAAKSVDAPCGSGPSPSCSGLTGCLRQRKPS